MKKLISYFWPSTKRFSSEINGTLEVTFIDGKKVLDTLNANYSYGSLQKILEVGLNIIDLSSVKNVLLLGLGGGSIIKSLREKYNYQNNIVAVEIDPQVVKLAKTEFGIIPSKYLQIIQGDAFEYVKNSEEKFQLIIIDLFIDINVPPIFYGKEFCTNTARLIANEGSIIFNAGINLNLQTKDFETVSSNFGNDFNFKIHRKVNGTNTLLIGVKRQD